MPRGEKVLRFVKQGQIFTRLGVSDHSEMGKALINSALRRMARSLTCCQRLAAVEGDNIVRKENQFLLS